jgi:hypothetical protein
MKIVFITRYFSKILLAAVLICGCTFYASAQKKPKVAAKPVAVTPVVAGAKPVVVVPKSVPAILETFFKKYKDSSDAAIDYLFGTNKYFTNTGGINQLKQKLDSLRITLGAYAGKELIVQKSASPSLILYTYLVKHDIQPVRFTFMFYKPHSDWVLYRFKYDEEMDVELEEGAKINNKHP